MDESGNVGYDASAWDGGLSGFSFSSAEGPSFMGGSYSITVTAEAPPYDGGSLPDGPSGTGLDMGMVAQMNQPYNAKEGYGGLNVLGQSMPAKDFDPGWAGSVGFRGNPGVVTPVPGTEVNLGTHAPFSGIFGH